MLRGLVLCGGQSSRMGRDKGSMVAVGTATWAAQAATLLCQVTGMASVISVNAGQAAVYADMWPSAAASSTDIPLLVTDDESLPVHGPLKGVLSAHKALPATSFLVLACDMPLMQAAVPQYLCHQAAGHPQAEAVVFANGDQVEPLCGIYTVGALLKTAMLVQTGVLKKSSMRHMLAMLLTHYVPVPEQMQGSFVNCNTPEQALIAGKVSAQF